jgi:hypothetical protein
MTYIEQQVAAEGRGRLVLLSRVRAKLGLKPVSRRLLSARKGGSLRMGRYQTVAERNRGLLAGLPTAGESTVDELFERRSEAAREDCE